MVKTYLIVRHFVPTTRRDRTRSSRRTDPDRSFHSPYWPAVLYPIVDGIQCSLRLPYLVLRRRRALFGAWPESFKMSPNNKSYTTHVLILIEEAWGFGRPSS